MDGAFPVFTLSITDYFYIYYKLAWKKCNMSLNVIC